MLPFVDPLLADAHVHAPQAGHGRVVFFPGFKGLANEAVAFIHDFDAPVQVGVGDFLAGPVLDGFLEFSQLGGHVGIGRGLWTLCGMGR